MTKCTSCGGRMASARGNHVYEECGLPNIVLRNVEIRRCEACGEDEVVIPRIEELHRAIATAVISKKPRLMPAEIRFLRKHLGWSGVQFAQHIGVTPETVSRWENGHEPMGPTADRLLRVMVSLLRPKRDYSVESLAEIEEVSRPTALRLSVDRDGWHSEAA